ncbi:MAG: PQQ-binding-like beta-propeller repeat protein [Candidatus Marinimicrobia bacterium]|nr:PQQ-binding-like beta-propeller repeat protein [Candidatus Neomarinimicrobiota bacterium]MCF7829925.1 PQQ-binding-like beta-propeller repeat protein [Candidatus Neomarinimicrobiota bacterium]MCF7879112.1 PQQ-binding-like beta-propeller repeat protein [Candidatus Neomarinimicrobiota bacterium]
MKQIRGFQPEIGWIFVMETKKRNTILLLSLVFAIFLQCKIDLPIDDDEDEHLPPKRLALRWEYKYEKGAGFLTLSPTVVSDSTIVFSGAPMLESLTILNGRLLWQSNLHNDMSLQSDHLLYNNEILVAPQTDRVLVWDRKSGNSIWNYLVPKEDVGSVGLYYNALEGNCFYLAGTSTVQKIQLLDGLSWSTRFYQRIVAVLVQDTLVYASTFKSDNRKDGAYEIGNVISIHAVTGDSLWAYSISGSAPSYTAPLLGDGTTIYVGSNSASGKHTDIFRTYAIDAHDGDLVWKTSEEVFTYHHILIGDTIYGNDGLGLYALDKHTGDLLWQTDLEVGHGERPVAYWDGYLYHAKGGALHVVDARTGEIVIHKMLGPDKSSVRVASAGAGAVFVQTNQHLYCYEPYQPGEE